MTLEQLIHRLESENPDKIVPTGFNSPHSYRGYYDELAFEPVENITVAAMLACAKEALGSTYEGYKGGEFVMHEHTEIHLAHYGQTGEGIGNVLLDYMLGKVKAI